MHRQLCSLNILRGFSYVIFIVPSAAPLDRLFKWCYFGLFMEVTYLVGFNALNIHGFDFEVDEIGRAHV